MDDTHDKIDWADGQASWLTSGQNTCGYSIGPEIAWCAHFGGLKASSTLLSARKAARCCWLLTYNEARTYCAADVLAAAPRAADFLSCRLMHL